MKIYKFGGASVNCAEAVRNMVSIVGSQRGEEGLLVVVSAMGKTTNALERLVPGIGLSEGERQQVYRQLVEYHCAIAEGLGLREQEGMLSLLEQLRQRMLQGPTTYNFDYDQIVSFGELISTTIISSYLNQAGLENRWIDARELIRTDRTYRDARVDWAATQAAVAQQLGRAASSLCITQGFIAGAPDGSTTTLGREGSDYSAAILSHCLEARCMTIWKDVPGFLNADPKYFPNTVKIDRLPYNEAIELAYYGASVIHPKTVKPLQNRGIELRIKSFLDPTAEGSLIGPYPRIEPQTPLYIVRRDQVLLSILPKDFSFIAEDNLQTIFAALSEAGVRVNLMQNSALSFSLCLDDNPVPLAQLQERLAPQFRLKHNKGLQLVTIRYYTQEIIDRIVDRRPVLLQQRSRTTAQLIVGQPVLES